MMKSIKYIICLLAIVSQQTATAQQDAMFTHYSFNTLGVNPGYAGSRDALTVTALHRSQWVSFPGAPNTQTLTAHMPVWKDNLGVGVSFLHDKIGPTRTFSVYADFAYKIKIGGKGKLALGVKGGLNIRNDELLGLSVDQQNDPNFQQNFKSQLLPNFGFGAYYYHPKFYVGFSIPRLLENNFNDNTTSGGTNLASEARHYYLIAGGIFNITKDKVWKIKPSMLLKMTVGAPVELDLTALFYFKNLVWFGPTYRTSDAVGILAGVNPTKQFSIGYSFDWSYGNRSFRYNGGTHEIMLRYDFIFNKKGKIISPRYF